MKIKIYRNLVAKQKDENPVEATHLEFKVLNNVLCSIAITDAGEVVTPSVQDITMAKKVLATIKRK